MGILSDLTGSFTGSTAKNTLAQGNQQATAELNAGYARANPYYDKASAVYQPFVNAGVNANNAYNNALGVNGAGAAQDAYNNYASNPGFLAAEQLGLKNLDRRYNAGGLANSGANYAGQANAGINYYDQYLNRLQGQGQQGLNAAGGQSNAFANQGNFTYGYGKDLASNDIQYANAKAQADNVFGQNVIGLAGAGLSGANALGNLGYKPFGK